MHYLWSLHLLNQSNLINPTRGNSHVCQQQLNFCNCLKNNKNKCCENVDCGHVGTDLTWPGTQSGAYGVFTTMPDWWMSCDSVLLAPCFSCWTLTQLSSCSQPPPKCCPEISPGPSWPFSPAHPPCSSTGPPDTTSGAVWTLSPMTTEPLIHESILVIEPSWNHQKSPFNQEMQLFLLLWSVFFRFTSWVVKIIIDKNDFLFLIFLSGRIVCSHTGALGIQIGSFLFLLLL